MISIAFYRALYSLKSEASRTVLSFLWWILAPIIDVAVLYFVFSTLLGNKTNNFLIVLSVGVLNFNWFSSALNNASNSLYGQRHIVVNTNSSLYSLVLACNLSDTFKYICVMLLFVLGVALFQGVNSAFWLLPVTFLVQFVLVFVVSLLFAVAIPLLPDLRLILSVVIQVLIFSSGIFFSAGSVPESYRAFFLLNPMANLIELNRIALVPGYSALVPLADVLLLLLAGVTLITVFTYLIYKLAAPRVRKVI